MKKIKWGCIQPLTGGMYIGALQAIGNDAEWILSYDGLDYANTDKENNYTTVGNEYNLLKWLEKENKIIPYYKIKNRKMFDLNIYENNPDIYLDNKLENPDYNDLDLVVAVPVCSGLSMVTKGNTETKNSRNCNMLWLTYYTLNIIKPKVYCFENAPTLVGDRGDEVRKSLQDIAEKSGYSVLYYKTDTVLHDNCQRRPRTFVIFFKWQNNKQQTPPIFEYYNHPILVKEFFDKISSNASQQIPVVSQPHNYILIDYLKEKLGDNWNTQFNGNIMNYVINNNLFDEFKAYIQNSKYSDNDKQKTLKYVNTILSKKKEGKNYYSEDACLFNKYFPSVQFRSIPNMLHYSGERFCTIREYLSLMGLPENFELYGNESSLPKIGQNVPVGTAKFIVQQILNCLNNWNYINRVEGTNYIIQDNIKQTELN